MRFTTSVACVAVLECLGSPLLGQTDDGFVGVYADSQGTAACATVPPMSGTTLYVIAKPAGASANGITGSEFRIEISRPTGWFFSYTPPASAAVVVGNPLDTNPSNLDDGSGFNISFASCRQPVNGRIQLGTISAFNMSGTSTGLYVKRHSSPRSLNYICPLFVLCDSPQYSLCCMTPSTEVACSTLAVPKPSLALNPGESAVSSLGLNPEVFPVLPPLPSVPFTETFNLGASELWVGGRKVFGPQVQAVFENEELRLNGELVTFLPYSAPPQPDSVIARVYGGAPRVVELQTSGRTLREARDQYLQELKELFGRATAKHQMGGFGAALAELQASPLVQVVETEPAANCITVARRGTRGRDLLCFTEGNMLPSRGPIRAPESKGMKARRLVDDLKIEAGVVSEGMLMLVTRSGNTTFLGGQDRVRAQAQIQYVLEHRSAVDLPSGPLNPKSWMVKEIVAAVGGE